ncbi:MAG TPA: chemotaxis protein CheW [Leptolyngbyaceae cyanobacterium]
MKDQPYLLFALHNRYYGIEAQAVREIFFLPEICGVAEAHSTLVGVLNLRGALLPVVDLSQHLGQGLHNYALSDSIIVLTQDDQHIAVVVSHVFDVVRLTLETSVANLFDRQSSSEQIPNSLGLAQWEDRVVTLLDATALVRASQAHLPSTSLQGAAFQGATLHGTTTLFQERFFPQATPEEKIRLRERAESLRHAAAEDRFHEQIPLAVVGMQGERFALPVEYIREFTPIRGVTPIPCCPSHVVGNMNLRGEILTLVDIRQVLQLEASDQGTLSQAVVVQVDNLIAGITVEMVYDVMYVRPASIAPIPVATHSVHEEYLRGVVTFQKYQVSLLDLNKLLTGDELLVNEAA